MGGWSEQRELLSSVGTSRGNFLKFGRHGRHEQGEPRLLQSRYRRERVPGRWPQVTVFVLVTIQPLLLWPLVTVLMAKGTMLRATALVVIV